MKKSKASDVAILAIFIAIMVVVQLFTQFVINVWPFPVKPTLLHLPVIIGSIILGWRKGAFLGLVWGLISFVTATIVTTPTSFLFSPFQSVIGTYHGSPWGLFIAFIPRILVGILPYFVYKIANNRLGAGLAAFAGTATNTVLVLTSIFLFFGSTLKWSLSYLLGAIVATNSLTEVIIAVILTTAIVPALTKARNNS